MIVDERMVTYINSLDRGNTEFLNQLEREALENRVPIIRREMQSFLKVLLAIKHPKRILEVGTAVGFSALLMSTYEDPHCQREFQKGRERAPDHPSSRRCRGDPKNLKRAL